MNETADLDEKRNARAMPFLVKDASDFEGRAVPDRDWLIPSVLVRRSLTLLGGDGGTGKSLLCLQLQVAAALGASWLGLDMPEKISSFGYYCEDDEEEIHRRLWDVCRHFSCTFKDLDGRVRFVSRVGEDNELITFRGYKDSARPVRTDLYRQVEDEVKQWGAQLVIIDTAADAFAGNENIRPQVRAFVNMIRRLALIHNGGVVLNAHPSKSSMVDGSGFSGSTAWNGSVRNRLYLTRPKAKSDGEEDGPTNDRLLKVMKSNYGPFGEQIQCRWEKGVFVRTDKGPGSLIDRLEQDARILKAAEYLIGNGNRLAAAHKAKNSFASQINGLPSCRDLSWGMLCKAQDRLLAEGKLVKVEVGPPSGRVVCVRPPHMHFSGEANGD